MQGNGPPSGNVGGPPQANGGATGEFGGRAMAGMSQIGEAGWLRLFTPPLSKEVSWLLHFSLGGLGLLIASTRPRWTITREHQAAVLWGGWLLTGAVFFSIAGFFHEYYLSMLAAPLAALVGIGSAQLWRLRANRPWLALILLLLFGGITLALQLKTAQSFVGNAWWLLPSLGLFVVGAIVSFQATLRTWRRLTLAGWATIGLALLITPGIWAGLTTLNPSNNQSLPSAYSGEPSAPANNGAIQVNSELIDYLQANTQGVRYLMAVPSSMQGSDYVLATSRPVLYLGGFMGQDKVLSTEQLAQLVKDSELRYIYTNAGESSGRGGPSSGSQSNTSSWIRANCTVVDGFATQTHNMGAPGGTEAASDTSTAESSQGGMGGFQIQLYDCAGQ
ncbi:MAG: hypothetical protein HGA19_09835 [Oscillochloris sp.]|nr:hypothetical protein [Oscillochloris sp.]